MNENSGITVDKIKLSLRIDGNLDDELIQRLIDVSEAYIKDAVDSTVELSTYRQYKQFNIAVALFAEFLYQNRGIVGTAPNARPLEITSMIQQLRGIDFNGDANTSLH